jgi:hypothetical protein
MKQRIFHNEFNDKNFWQMFDPNNAIEFFMPNRELVFNWFKAKGGVITIEDSSIHDKYMRNIEIWVEHPDPTVITELGLRL